MKILFLFALLSLAALASAKVGLFTIADLCQDDFPRVMRDYDHDVCKRQFCKSPKHEYYRYNFPGEDAECCCKEPTVISSESSDWDSKGK